jgi:hypothetical protein
MSRRTLSILKRSIWDLSHGNLTALRGPRLNVDNRRRAAG